MKCYIGGLELVASSPEEMELIPFFFALEFKNLKIVLYKIYYILYYNDIGQYITNYFILQEVEKHV